MVAIVVGVEVMRTVVAIGDGTPPSAPPAPVGAGVAAATVAGVPVAGGLPLLVRSEQPAVSMNRIRSAIAHTVAHLVAMRPCRELGTVNLFRGAGPEKGEGLRAHWTTNVPVIVVG